MINRKKIKYKCILAMLCIMAVDVTGHCFAVHREKLRTEEEQREQYRGIEPLVHFAGALFRRFGEKEDFLLRTETEPIYHHFPDLPKTEDMEWCSTSSGGIGLVTTRLYLYCWYDHDIREELLDLELGQEIEQTEQTLDVFYFIPERLIQQPQAWSKLDHSYLAFQTGIKDGEKMNTEIYLSADGTVLYLEAVGD